MINNIFNCQFCYEKTKDFVFLENERFYAIYNISPILPGHSLIIPKKHIVSLFELNKIELMQFMTLAQTSAKLLSKVFEVNSFNWSIQERPAAGQSISHLHMHVIPRKEGDLKYPGEWNVKLNTEFYSSNIDSNERPKLQYAEIVKIVNKLKEYI